MSTRPPFDNLKVRQAFSHVVDRDAIQKTILGPAGTPAYSWLAPGFPASNREGLKDIQKYDIATAKQLLADAGFPDGKNFPKQTLWLRNAVAARPGGRQRHRRVDQAEPQYRCRGLEQGHARPSWTA